MSIDIDTAALERLRAYAHQYQRPAGHVAIYWSQAGAGVIVEWWSGREHRTAEEATANEALAKLLAEIDDPGPCPCCGYPQEAPADDELCETCLTRLTAARWQAEMDYARGK